MNGDSSAIRDFVTEGFKRNIFQYTIYFSTQYISVHNIFLDGNKCGK